MLYSASENFYNQLIHTDNSGVKISLFLIVHYLYHLHWLQGEECMRNLAIISAHVQHDVLLSVLH